MSLIRRVASGLAVFCTCLGLSQNAFATSSNRDEVRKDLESGHHVVWGHNFTEGDWYEGTQAIINSVATENPGPFIAFFDYKLQQNITKIQSNLPGVAAATIKGWIKDSLKQKKFITYNGFKLQAGFATYKRWERIIYDEPQTYRCKVKGPFGSWTWGVCTRSVQKERRITMPNYNQFYIRYQFVNDIPAGVEEYRRIYIQNKCSKAVDVAANFTALNGASTIQGFWRVQPGKAAYIFNTKANSFYYHAATTDGAHVWEGNVIKKVGGRSYKFKPVTINQSGYGKWTLNLTCNQQFSVLSLQDEGEVSAPDDGESSGEVDQVTPEDVPSNDGWNDSHGQSGGDGWNSPSARADSWGVESAASVSDWSEGVEGDYSGLTPADSEQTSGQDGGGNGGWE